MEKHSNFDRVMEAGDHFKNGAGSKSHTSRGYIINDLIKTKISLFAFVFFISAFSTYAQLMPGNVGPRGNSYDDPANGIYVAPDGNDATATGSIGSPYKSINAALAAAQPGATVILRGGTYHEGTEVRPRIPNVTVKSRRGEWAVIELIYDPGIEWDSGVYFDTEASGCKLQCVEVKGGFYAVCMETTFQWDPADPFTYGASNIIIEDCILHDSRYDVVKVKPNCNNITIRYNEIYNSGQAFTPPYYGEDNAEGIDNVNGNNMIVQNNYIHDIVGTGVYAKGGATDALIENNIIERIYGAGIMVGFDTNLEWFSSNVNPDYYENIRGVVCNNLIIDAGWEGIGLYASKDAKVYNNTLINAVCGVSQYHSAIYFGVAPQDYDDNIGHPANINPDIHHNVVCMWPTSNRPMIDIRYSLDCGGMSALSGMPAIHDNCYYIAGKSASFNDQRPGSILENKGLAEWKTHTGGDNGSLEVNPALDANYITANTQCAGMGILFPLILNNPTGIAHQALLPETSAYINNGILYIQNPVAETVRAYSINGALLFNLQKPEGKVSYPMNQPGGTTIILMGGSGWTKKLFVQ